MDYETFYRDLRKPEFIPGYEILRKLGSGVFGDVFKARKKSIGRIYVIKFLKTENETQRVIIEKELASLQQFAQIDHPNLVGIEDQGAVQGIPYIIMTFAGDQTLQDRLCEGPLERSELGTVFDQIVSGVAALHERAIVHFDLKPANIFLRESTVRVGDYGLAKMLSESRQSLSFGRGTPYYMAPEVMRRKGDLRSDVYSLGTILYELITGRVPFDGDSDWEVLKKHEVEPVPFPDAFPPGLRSVVETAMRKNPEDRFASAVALRHAFRTVAARELEGMSEAVRTRSRSRPSRVGAEVAAAPRPDVGDRTGSPAGTGIAVRPEPSARPEPIPVAHAAPRRRHGLRVLIVMGGLGVLILGFVAFLMLPMLLMQPDSLSSPGSTSAGAAFRPASGTDASRSEPEVAPEPAGNAPVRARGRPLDMERFRRSLEDVLFVVNLINTQGQVLEATRSLAGDEEASQLLSRLLEKLNDQKKSENRE